ncbi:MAG: SMI1/KNR4 family protein [Chloroflexi bacterium]|nr:MAG: SMI1/KNR4 family protein [Chloroflexota bacterium]
MNYKYLLIEIDRRRRLRGKELQPACTKNQLEQLAAKVREELNTELPKDYTELLSYTNGISYNGLVIYASENLLFKEHKTYSFRVL